MDYPFAYNNIMDESFLNRLRMLGVQIGTDSTTTHASPKIDSGIPIEKIIPGKSYSTIFGDAFVFEKQYSPDYRHGMIDFNGRFDLTTLLAWSRLPVDPPIQIDEIVFLDTETSGLAGGSGTLVFLVGLGYWKQGNYHITQVFLRHPAEEDAFLTALDELITPFRIMVTYNGKSFDAPLLNNRYILNGFNNPLKEKHHIDLLSLTRRIWRNRLNDRSLGNLEQEILGFHRSAEEIPGWMVPQMYFEYLQTQNADPMKGVFYHNEVDIVSLSALFVHLANLLQNPLEANERQSLDWIAIARLYEELKDYDRAVQLYEASLKIGLPTHFFIQTLYRFASLYRRTGEYDKALVLWMKAVEFNEVEACVEIAKYYEHHQKSHYQALEWTETALKFLNTLPLPRYIKKQKIKELEHRRNRLLQKSGKPHNGISHE